MAEESWRYLVVLALGIGYRQHLGWQRVGEYFQTFLVRLGVIT